jgi:hypothetical protein
MYVPFERHNISQEARKFHDETYSNVESLESIAGSSTERENLGSGIRNADLEITVGVFLF